MVARREETPTVPRSEESVETKLRRIAEKARREPSFKFNSLYHLMNEELLRGWSSGYVKMPPPALGSRLGFD